VRPLRGVRSGFDDREDFVFADHHELFAVKLNINATILAEQDSVTNLDLRLANLTVVE
jgi:hypothetical protein